MKHFESGTMCIRLAWFAEEVEKKITMKKIKRNKAVGQHSILAKASIVSVKEGVDILWVLLREIEDHEVILEKGRKKAMVPIFKEKEDLP